MSSGARDWVWRAEAVKCSWVQRRVTWSNDEECHRITSTLASPTRNMGCQVRTMRGLSRMSFETWWVENFILRGLDRRLCYSRQFRGMCVGMTLEELSKGWGKLLFLYPKHYGRNRWACLNDIPNFWVWISIQDLNILSSILQKHRSSFEVWLGPL